MDSLKTKTTLNVNGKDYQIFSLRKAEKLMGDISRLPYTLKILLENILRFENGEDVTVDDARHTRSAGIPVIL